MLSGKIMDIQFGSMLKSETIEHDGSTKTLKSTLAELARLLTGEGSVGSVSFAAPSISAAGTSRIERITPLVSGNKKSKSAGLLLKSDPTKAEVWLGDMRVGNSLSENGAYIGAEFENHSEKRDVS